MDKLQYKIYHENKIHTPDDFPYNTYLCSIPLDFQSVNLHWHDEVEIIVIKKGSGIVSVDLTTYSVSAGDIIFVLPGQLHAISQKDNEIMEYENILFKSSLLKSSGYDLCNDKFIQPLFSGSLNICPVINNQTPYYPPVITAINEIDHLCDLRPYAYNCPSRHIYFKYYILSFQTAGKIKSNQSTKNLSKK